MSTFLPAATLLLAIVGAQGPAVSIEDFRAGNEATKARILADVALPRANVAIAQVIGLVRAGLRDPSPNVRMSALGTVQARAMLALAARWFGTPGVQTRSFSGPPPPELPLIPAEWQGDQQALREALEDDCLALLKGDPDDRVRYEALLAVGNLERPAQSNDTLADWLVRLFVDLYRHDPFVRIRAEVVKTFRLVPNNSPEMRAVLRDALVDTNASIRHEGLTGITPEATAASRRLSFDEARDTIAPALKHADASVRLGAVQALNVFGAPAAPYIETLDRLSRADPDAHVRASARLAIEAIQRALRRD